MKKSVLAIILTILLVILSFLTYLSFQTNNDFYIFKILMIILDLGFFIGCIFLLFSFSIKQFIYWLFLPIFCFFMYFGADINIYLRIICTLVYAYIGLKIHKII